MIEVRPAHHGDAPKVRALLGLLGYDVPVEDVRKRLSDLAERNTDPVLLAAEADMAVGLIAHALDDHAACQQASRPDHGIDRV